MIINPYEIGDYCNRKRVYIAMVHTKVLRDDISSNSSMESTLRNTLDLLKVVGRPSDPFLVCAGPRTLLFQYTVFFFEFFDYIFC